MRKSFSLLLATITFLVNAQNSQRIFEKIKFSPSITEITVNDGKYEIRYYQPDIIETAFIPKGETLKNKSHAVILSPSPVNQKFSENENIITIATSELSIKVQKKPFQISYFRKGKELLSEKNGYGTYKNGEINGHPQDFETLNFNLDPQEVLYGGGARALGMNRRGNRLMLYNRAHYGYENRSELLNYTLPIVLSSKKYLLHFDNAPIGYLDLDSKKDNSLTYETISGRKVYQIVSGNSWENLTQNYTKLTGTQPMPPRWSLGNFSSRFGYHSQKETVETIQKFRDEKIPVDAIILDLYWFGKDIKGTMGNLAFDKDNFPNPSKMIQDLRNQNVETILITEPFILNTSTRWNEALEKDILAKDKQGKPFLYEFYFGNTGLIDIYSPKGKNWFKNIYKDLLKQGITGIWGDLGEPEVHPSALQHYKGSADEVHNIYGHNWAELVQESFKESLPKLRPFTLMRAGYSGSQRFGMIPWSGDVNRTWGGLQSQPEIALQMGMQGVAYMHSDLGGFAGANLDDELYARWLQYGVFQPIYRPHAQEEVPSEPVFRSEKAKLLAKKAIELRYAMLPYNYHLTFENHTKGTPMMKPLFFEEPENLELTTYSDAYLWGNNFLVAPVLKSQQKTSTVYFPKSSDWIDFYTHKKYKGGTKSEISLQEEFIPTFVRAGSIIPMAPAMQSTKEYFGNPLKLHFYYDEKVKTSETMLFNDDGLTKNSFENGAFELMKFGSSTGDHFIELYCHNKLGKKYKGSQKQIEWTIHNMDQKPKSVISSGKNLKFSYDSEGKTITVNVEWNSVQKQTIKIVF